MSSVYCFTSPSNCLYLELTKQCHSVSCICQPYPVFVYRPLLKFTVPFLCLLSTVPSPCLSFTFYCHKIPLSMSTVPRQCRLSPVYVYRPMSLSSVYCLLLLFCLPSNVLVCRPMSLSTVQCPCLPSIVLV